MRHLRILSRLSRNHEGAAAIEFALVAPVLITMLLGVLMIGLHMQAYNSVRSAAFDTERFTVVEYQRQNEMLPAQIEQVAVAIATRSPYNFNPDEVEACVDTVASGMAGAARYELTLSYRPPDISGLLPSAPTIQFTQPIIVPGSGVAASCDDGGEGGDGGDGGTA